MSDEEGNVAERLMSALISKMESMDEGLQSLRSENEQLRKMVMNPANMLRKAGFVPARTQRPEDVLVDGFRGEIDDTLLKSNGEELAVPVTNADFHKMDWADIHALADQAKEAGAIGQPMGME